MIDGAGHEVGHEGLLALLDFKHAIVGGSRYGTHLLATAQTP
jgi:hypothetical protein